MIKLWEDDKTPLFDDLICQAHPSIEPFIVDGAKTCIIVCPGGGYGGKSDHEGKPIAEMLNSFGVSAFVLDYRVSPYMFPCETADIKRSVRVVRYLSEKYGYEKDKIGVMGFSAGGHLAASACVVTENVVPCQDEIDNIDSIPNFMVLCYPVITFDDDHAHFGTRNVITGGNRNLYDMLSIEKRVTDRTPPAFIWHTTDDNVVDVENSLYLVSALRRRRIDVEFHSFMSGEHGIGLAKDRPDIGIWVTLLKNWLIGMGML